MLVELRKVGKVFSTPRGPVVALDAVEAALPEGKVIGLLGPNGSGKTTLLRILVGLLQPDSGEVRYAGRPLSPEVCRRFGYMPEERGLYPKTAAKDQLRYLLQLRGFSRQAAEKEIQYWAERLHMPWLDRPARALSKGMQQKVQLTLALAGSPELLLLDEPFSGVDPIVAAEMEALLRERVAQGATLLLSTHRLEQVDTLCDYVLLIHKGRLYLAGETTTLRRRYWQRLYEIETTTPVSALPWPAGVQVTPQSDYRALLQLPESLSANALLQELLPHTDVRFFAEKLPTIREIFLQIVGIA